MTNEKKRSPVPPVLFTLLWIIGVSAIVMLRWYTTKWSTGFQEMLYTITSPLKGTGSDVLNLGLRDCLPPIILLSLGGIILMLLCCRNGLSMRVFKAAPGRVRRVLRRTLCVLAALLIPFTCVYANCELGILDYYQLQSQQTIIYDDEYVDPETAGLTQADGQRNLIWIVIESMETSYASQADGGAQAETNYMPLLTQLATDNVSFSDGSALGGFRSPTGTSWTMAALFAQNSGVPYTFPISENLRNLSESYAPGVTTIGDLLAERGYTQEFLCGSDATFGGRRSFFVQHGNYRIMDLLEAKSEGYIPQDYYKWWGFEDQKLFEIAKTEVTELAASGQPFNLTLLTVDTHHPYGYVCDLCEGATDTDDAHTGTVVSCTDRQVTQFIAWLQEQDFYENTVIVVTGDHPRMDTGLTAGLAWEDRTVYNAFINAACDVSGATTDRLWTTMDVMPTVMAAMGFTWNGHRLGLGTDLFSGEQTLCEQLGWDALNTELSKSSAFYLEHFANK